MILSLTELFYNLNSKHNNIITLLKKYKGNDWKKYVINKTEINNINRNIIHSNPNFDMIVITWGLLYNTGQHYHNDIHKCYYKSLEGKLLESIQSKNINIDKIIYPNNVNTISNNIGTHSIRNISNDISSSLHIYHKNNIYPKIINSKIINSINNFWIINHNI